MNTFWGIVSLIVLVVLINHGAIFAVRKIQKKKITPFKERVKALQEEYDKLDNETKALQELKKKRRALIKAVKEKEAELETIWDKIESLDAKNAEADVQINKIKSKVDLYSRIEDFVGYGHFEMPDYLFETSERFAVEIKSVREKQKELIKSDNVLKLSMKSSAVNIDLSFIDKLYSSQKKLIIRTFNIECDFLIGKIGPANLERTLKQIASLAGDLEKASADLRYGFSKEYLNLKLEECRLQFQFKLKKKEEQDEQRLIKEQIREEEKATREYEQALKKAEQEEKVYAEMLVKARAEFEQLNEQEKQKAQEHIEKLERELQEAHEKAQRTKSMAEQTKRGHIYVISNIGSFGEDVYKIGMTRRLDPMERVKELGDASVPFSFDVHAIIFTEDAPKLENELHKIFHNNRMNAVNLRKEFFRVPLEDIRKNVELVTGNEAEFTTTILAEEYYQTKRLRNEQA